MSHRKRKHRQWSDAYNNQYDQPANPSSTRADPSLFIVAHEADVIRGPQAARTADSLEVGINVDGQGGSRIGDGLIKWEGGPGAAAEGGGMWVDRCVRLFVLSWNEYAVLRICRTVEQTLCLLVALIRHPSIDLWVLFFLSFHPHCPRP